MKPPSFEYHRADSIEECLALLAEYGDEAKVLAGGQSLVPLLAMRLSGPAHLIDINHAGELSSLSLGSFLAIGATVRHRTIEREPMVRGSNPLLAASARLIGHGAIRNRGTVGGSVAHADPAAELPTVVMLLDSSMEVRSVRGTRTVTASDFFLGFLTTALESDELLTAIHVPMLGSGTGWSFQEFNRRSGDFAIVGVAASVRLDQSGDIAETRLAFSGVGTQPIRATEAEKSMAGLRPTPDVFAAAASAAASRLEPPSDLHGSATYRRHLAGVLTEQALIEATGRARREE